MKKALSFLVAVTMAGSGFGQGTILFSNAGLTGPNGPYNAVLKMPDGIMNLDSRFTVGLFAPDGTTLLATDTIFGDTGLFFGNGEGVIVPGYPTASTPTLTVRAWETSAGSFANAVYRGEASFTTRPLGGPKAAGPPDVPVDMGNFGNPITGIGWVIAPEPSIYALGMIGLGALAMMRRRK